MALAVIRRSALYARNFMTSAARRSGEHSEGGIPGENLPFSISNRYRLTALFTIFLGSGLAAPFLLVRHQLLKK